MEVDDEENPAISVDSASLKSDKDLKIKTETIINKEKEYDLLEEQKVSLEMPVTSVQFQNTWKYIKRKPINAFTYLKVSVMLMQRKRIIAFVT